ncbi:MAG: GNAT family N-acetyltransferase, partial [Deltaproteobacteria bacterium]|nr:GNAT family N-acetyltransferase [Deltaproteobacteria bacterium]
MVPAGPSSAPALAALFERADVPCHCRYWHFPGDDRAWLARCALEPEQNRAELEESLASGRPDGRGLVALDDAGSALGWLKLVPALAAPKLVDRRPYRGLPCLSGPRDDVVMLGCLLVDPAARRRGVARALVTAAVASARGDGYRA